LRAQADEWTRKHPDAPRTQLTHHLANELNVSQATARRRLFHVDARNKVQKPGRPKLIRESDMKAFLSGLTDLNAKNHPANLQQCRRVVRKFQ